MRVRDHVAISTAGAALLYPFLGRAVLGAWAGSILIDIDHYLWFCVRRRSVNPVAAVRFFNQADTSHDQATRIFHSPLAISLALLVGAWQRKTRPVAVGMALHVGLDTYHEARMGRARAEALERDDFRCQVCGAKGTRIETHLKEQPLLLASYRTQNLISLCSTCHAAAHAQTTRPVLGFIPAASVMIAGRRRWTKR